MCENPFPPVKPKPEPTVWYFEEWIETGSTWELRQTWTSLTIAHHQAMDFALTCKARCRIRRNQPLAGTVEQIVYFPDGSCDAHYSASITTEGLPNA